MVLRALAQNSCSLLSLPGISGRFAKDAVEEAERAVGKQPSAAFSEGLNGGGI